MYLEITEFRVFKPPAPRQVSMQTLEWAVSIMIKKFKNSVTDVDAVFPFASWEEMYLSQPPRPMAVFVRKYGNKASTLRFDIGPSTLGELVQMLRKELNLDGSNYYVEWDSEKA